MSSLITITSSALPDSTQVLGFRGMEALSRPYEIEVFLALAPGEGAPDLGDAVGARAVITLDRAADSLLPFHIAGVLASVGMIRENVISGVIVPRLWLLGLSAHSRMFTHVTVKDVITTVLEDNGMSDYELRLSGAYEVEDHICQYRESDLDFLSRWMEREGIFYFFEHGEGGETLILCDTKAYPTEPLGKPVRYYPHAGQDRLSGPSFRAFTCRHTTLPSRVTLKDYDHTRPNLNVSGSARVTASGGGEVSLYGERFFTPAAGDRLARLRAEELRARAVVYQAQGTRTHLRPGYTFTLEDHPWPALNDGYLVTELQHSANQAAGSADLQQRLGLLHEEVYFAELSAIPAATQFRPERRAPWPRIYGYENGITDGPMSSEYAQLDDHGRYKIKFKFDESDKMRGKASTWVRMMQPHGGDVEGFHFPLRKGTEVVISFLGGDPDRPVISGVVPNALMPSPVTSGNNTKNVLQTGGRNRLELEDRAGQERITLSTPYGNSYLRLGAPNASHSMILTSTGGGLVDAGTYLDVRVGVDQTTADNVTTNDPSPAAIADPAPGDYTTVVQHDMITTVNTGKATFDVKAGTMSTTVKQDKTLHGEQNFFTGMEMGYAVAAKGGAQFIVGYEGLPATDMETDGFLVKVKKKFAVESEDEGEIKMAKSLLLSSGDGKATIEMKEDGTITIECDDWDVTNRGWWSHSHWGDEHSLTKGNSFEMLVGAKEEIGLANKFEFLLGLKEEITVGATFEAKLAPAFWSHEGDIKILGFKIETSLVDVKEAEAKVENHITNITLQQTVINTGVMLMQNNVLIVMN